MQPSTKSGLVESSWALIACDGSASSGAGTVPSVTFAFFHPATPVTSPNPLLGTWSASCTCIHTRKYFPEHGPLRVSQCAPCLPPAALGAGFGFWVVQLGLVWTKPPPVSRPLEVKDQGPGAEFCPGHARLKPTLPSLPRRGHHSRRQHSQPLRPKPPVPAKPRVCPSKSSTPLTNSQSASVVCSFAQHICYLNQLHGRCANTVFSMS